MKKTNPILLLGCVFWISCQNETPKTPITPAPENTVAADTAQPAPKPEPEKPETKPATEKNTNNKPATAKPSKTAKSAEDMAEHASGAPAPVTGGLNSEFADIQTLAPGVKLDIRYATTNNFTKAQIYDCPRCLLRPEPARAVAAAQASLQKRGLSLKMFDCYRPRPYQQRLWDKVPNPDYVTPPAKGSMHSRGAAVDLTIVDAQGVELDMGTPYDFFGEKAHTDYTRLPAHVLENRRLLRETMEAVGFKGIRTEWWHFSYQSKDYSLSNYVWPCRN